ncbi:MAG: class I SAM-dependent methyltransferase [Candidatus Thermoplasmatota archaeon]|nr:class I SAM-dependent methyltransferase [Candidatus Thermoplasmatota archaeon]
MTKISQIYEKSIGEKYKRESRTFDITDSHHILHIGCGAYPITALTLAKMNGSKIVGIDNNQKAIRLANEIVRNQQLDDRVTITYGDGTTYPVNLFDTIIISGCSSPKMQILDHVINTAKPQSKIIVRDINLNAKAVRENITAHHNIIWANTLGNYPIPWLGWQSFYLIKK